MSGQKAGACLNVFHEDHRVSYRYIRHRVCVTCVERHRYRISNIHVMARCHTSDKCIISRTDLKNICNVMIDSNGSIHTFKENGRDFITDIYTYWFV